MKTLLITIVSAFSFFLPITGFAAYVIHLKDGTRFVTDHYFEEGDQIKFKRYGGLIGVEKALVREIEEIEDLPEKEKPPETDASAAAAETGKKEKTREQAPGGDTLKPDGTGGDEESEGKAEAREKGQPEVAAAKEMSKEELDPEKIYKERKIALVRRLKEVLQSYKRAKEIGEKSVIDAEFRKASELSSDLSDLEKEVRARHDGILPAWWEESENTE